MSTDEKITPDSCRYGKKSYLCARVSPTRPAPRELRQALTGATVPGCSGAM